MKRFAFVLIGLLLVTGCVARRPEEPKPEFRLSVEFRPSWDDETVSMVVVHLHNDSDKPIRVWESWNSWGAYNASLEIILGDNPEIHTVGIGFRVWTMNFPSWEEVPVGGSFSVFLRLYEGSWSIDQEVLDWSGPVRIRPVFFIGEDEESVEAGVWTGSVRGDWVPASTPLDWIPRGLTSEQIYFGKDWDVNFDGK